MRFIQRIVRGTPVKPLAVLAVVFTFSTTSTVAQTSRWIAAWGTSQEVYGTTTLNNRTVRMFARVSIGGQAVRVRLDNTFSPAPVTFAKVYVGQQLVKRSGDSSSRNARLIPGSNRQAFFSGSATVTIPAGGTVTSDPVQMRVRAWQDLGVSLYVADTGIRPSSHNAAQTRSYMTANDAGDTAADESSTPFTSSTTTMFWLKGIDVLSASRGAIVAFGDSITDGTCSTFDGHDRWVDWLAIRLASLDGASAKAIVNEGLSSNTITTTRTNSGVERLNRDVLSHDAVTDVVLFMGTNDISRGVSRAQVIAGMQDIINRVRAEGIRIFGATILPRPDTGSWSAAKTQIRNDVNQWMRTGGAFDGVLDFDKTVRDPAHVNLLYPPFNCDDIHPSPLGHLEIARGVNLATLR